MAKRVSREASDATKFKQSLAKQGTNNPNYGKKGMRIQNKKSVMH